MSLYLITRPKNQAKYIGQIINKAGHEFLIDSMIDIKVNKPNYKLDFNKFSHFVITSSNACEYIKKINLNKNKIFFAVGDVSAQKLKNIGFNNVIYAQNSVVSLRNLMLKKLNKKTDKILYFCADVISYDLENYFRKVNVDFHSIIAYKTFVASSLKVETIKNIQSGKVDKILIYSQRTAEIFYNLLQYHNIVDAAINIEIICISKNIINFLQGKGFSAKIYQETVSNLI